MTEYLTHALESSKRLLSLVDRTELSPSYGCFDRNFWHYKTHDFPNAANQQGLLSLAKIFSLNNSPYYQSPYLLSLISGSISYTLSIQKKDGAFDEWYVNERGGAGPTAYLVHCFAETFLLLKRSLSLSVQNDLKVLIRKGINHLLSNAERHPLANHIAISMLASYQAYVILEDEKYLSHYENLKNEFLALFYRDEGWSIEYDGADPGYQTASISFLSRIHALNNEYWIEDFSLRSLEFISYFCYPDGSFSGSLGSRHTTNIFYAGIEYWRGKSAVAATISKWIKSNFSNGHSTPPGNHDDNYLIYRIPELIDAHIHCSKKQSATKTHLPFEKSNLDLSFSLSGHRFISSESTYFACSLNRGGAYKAFSKKSFSLISNDCGILIRHRNKLYSSLWNIAPKVFDPSLSSGNLTDITPKYFTPLRFIFFRMIFLLVGQHALTTRLLKNIIRSKLIFSKTCKHYRFKRTFVLKPNHIEIKTTIKTPKNLLADIQIGGEFWSRYVPQSRYFSKQDCHCADIYRNYLLKYFTSTKIINLQEEKKS